MSREKNFEFLFKENYSCLCQYAYKFLNNKEVCEDIVSDAFEYVWERYDELKVEDVVPILIQQVKYRCINYLRHRRVEERYASLMLKTTIHWEEQVDDEEKLNRIGKVIASLPLQTRRVLEECYFNRKKYSEVGELLAISPNTVKKHIVRALNLLREEFMEKSYK